MPITQITTPPIDRYNVPEGIKKFIAKNENDENQWWFSGDKKCPKTDWIEIFENLNYHCVYCRKPLGSTAEELVTARLDHIIPQIAFSDDESPNHEDNLVPCCNYCSAIKGDATLDSADDERWQSRKMYISALREYIEWRRLQVIKKMNQYVGDAIIYPWDNSPRYADFVD